MVDNDIAAKPVVVPGRSIRNDLTGLICVDRHMLAVTHFLAVKFLTIVQGVLPANSVVGVPEGFRFKRESCILAQFLGFFLVEVVVYPHIVKQLCDDCILFVRVCCSL